MYDKEKADECSMFKPTTEDHERAYDMKFCDIFFTLFDFHPDIGW